MTTCPVCHMSVDEKAAKAKMDYEGTTYYFCSEECRKQFEQNPKQYVNQTVAK